MSTSEGMGGGVQVFWEVAWKPPADVRAYRQTNRVWYGWLGVTDGNMHSDESEKGRVEEKWKRFGPFIILNNNHSLRGGMSCWIETLF